MTVQNGVEDPVAAVMELTDGLGVDAAIEAVGVPETFELCTELIRPGDRVANVGVHGHPVTLHLETLWIRDVTITTGLVDTFTTPQLLRLIEGGRLDPTVFVTHRFPLDETMERLRRLRGRRGDERAQGRARGRERPSGRPRRPSPRPQHRQQGGPGVRRRPARPL